MRFGVLGPLEVMTGDGRPVKVPELKVRALLADLLVHDGRTVSSDRLVADLWGEDPPAKPTGALRAKVSQLRRALGEAEPGARALVESRAPGYALGLGPDDLDARRFDALTAKARRTADLAGKAALLADALALWRGPAFADFAGEEFARGTAVRLEEQRLTALDDLAETRLALGEHNALIADLSDLVDLHPLRERTRATLMRALYRAGRQHDALAAYRHLSDRLRTELGLDPGPEITALHQAILAQDPALRAPSAAPGPRHNLPAPLTELIGRAEAVDDVRGLLQRDRLVTLTGPVGVGKTRLALEAAARSAGSFPGGVFLVELAALPRGAASADAIAETAATAVGVRDDGRGPTGAADRLVAALNGTRTLLVLDNCEHVIEQAAKLADLLLRTNPELRILATSQEPLGISGERVRAVPPLEVPAPGTDLPSLSRASAVRMFLARASAAADLALDEGNAAAVATICRRLDGVPLALELAAARVRALGVEQLAARLDDRFRLLATELRAVPERQRTLRAMMDWSWEPLTDPERAVLRRLAVHAGGSTPEAAEMTCGGAGVARGDVVDLLARLVDRSLVVMVDGPGGVRYRLLESVAAYCLERLDEAGETDRVQRRHDSYYTLLAECAEDRRSGPSRLHWLARLDAETANLRGALGGTTRRRDTRLALRLTAALAWYWIERGRVGEARRSLGLALAEAAEAPHLDGLSAARVAGDALAVAAALEGLAGAQILAGADAHAARLLGAAATATEAAADPGGEPHRASGRIVAAAREALGEAAFAGGFDAGRALGPDEAVGSLGRPGHARR